MSTSKKKVADFMRKMTPCYVVEDMVSELKTNTNSQERVFAAQAEGTTVVCWVRDGEPIRVSYVSWP